MWLKVAFTCGSRDACIRLGIKRANLSRYVLPALGGATLGAGAGALVAPEGQGLQGAFMGGALGAGGAAAGKAIARGVGKSQAAIAEKALAQALPEGGFLPMFDSPKIRALRQAARKATQGTDRNELGGAMLGGVIGAGSAMTGNSPVQAPYSSRIDPYGYSR